MTATEAVLGDARSAVSPSGLGETIAATEIAKARCVPNAEIVFANRRKSCITMNLKQAVVF